MTMLKKIVKYLWPILLRALLLEIEREIQHKLYGKGQSSKSARRSYQSLPKATPPKSSKVRVENESSSSRRPIKLHFKSAQQANELYIRAMHIVDEYGYVSVDDLYHMAGHDGGTYDDQNWGWSSLRDVERDDASLSFPRPTDVRNL